MRLEEIAQVTHEANRAIQFITEDPNPSDSWLDSSEETRESAIDGVVAVIKGATPKQSHENWCDFKANMNWKWGPVKNNVTRTHPCLVRYEELPEDQKIKDVLFVAIVNALKD